MSLENIPIYLDHLIPRMNLRYKRSAEELPTRPAGGQPEDLPMSDLGVSEFRTGILRKPDFQRATNAWLPEDCVSLLESVVNLQVIPSIIMWYSPDNGFEYVLDGGHRISVVMAWMRDDWGDKIPEQVVDMLDEQRWSEIQRAAIEVRQLVRDSVGSIKDYMRASDEFDEIVKRKGSPGQQMNDMDFKRALFYNDFRRRAIKFDVQWVEGTYEIAEKSFVKINKSGRQLSNWETKLVENRNSSFARTVMSITSPDSVQHYWPDIVAEEREGQNFSEQVTFIRNSIQDITNILYSPSHRSNYIQLQQPLMTLYGQDADKKPYWIAEVLTVIQHRSGTITETAQLLVQDNAVSVEQLIHNGYKLVEKMLDTFEHLVGNTPRSLGIVPSLYFYTRSVRYVRSSLYGFIYWLLSGTKQEILARKRLFCGYRGAFESVLLEYRDEFLKDLNRKNDSGSEVTVQIAHYYQEVLQLLIECGGDIGSPDFEPAYNLLLTEKFGFNNKASESNVARSRIFTSRQKATKRMEVLLASAPRCEICGGIFDPSLPHGYLQHDHRLEVSKGGQTSEKNQRLVHNFCNNQANREIIEEIILQKNEIQLPLFPLDGNSETLQLRLFEDELFSSPLENL